MAVDFGLLGNRNFTADALAGLQVGNTIQQMEANRQQQLQAQQMAQKNQAVQGSLAQAMQSYGFDPAANAELDWLMQNNPDAYKLQIQKFENLSKNRKQEYLQDMTFIRDQLKMGNLQGAFQGLNDRIGKIVERGGDPTDSMRLKKILEQDPNYALQGLENMVRTTAGFEFGKAKTNEFAPSVSPVQVDQKTGQQYVIYTDRNTGQSSRLDIVGGKAMTQDDIIQKNVQEAMLKAAVDVGNKAFNDLKLINNNIANMEKAVDTIDRGATYGQIENRLPTFEAATIELRNIANSLGLDVVAGTTFGALSEGELRLAMETAVPPLDEANLKGWFEKKIAAQKKVRAELMNMARTLGAGRTTIPQYIDMNMVKLPQEKAEPADDFTGFKIVN